MLDHLLSIDNLIKKRICIDNINIELANVKCKLIAAITATNIKY